MSARLDQALDGNLSFAHRIFASSLLMRFSSSSRALAFLRSAMNCTKPRIFELLLLERPKKPAADEAIMTRSGGLQTREISLVRGMVATSNGGLVMRSNAAAENGQSNA
jgi:hypothetical protein